MVKAALFTAVFLTASAGATSGVAKIAFVRSGSYGIDSQIEVMNADGTGQRKLSRNGCYDGHPSWSPDGTRIAFVSARSFRENQHTPKWSAFNRLTQFCFELYVMDADGSGLHRLTRDRANDAQPAWHGSRIAFVSDRDGNSEIYVMNVDGSRQRNLTRNRTADSYPAWSPDGKKVAFASARDDPSGRCADLAKCNLELYVMNADGSRQRRLTRDRAADSFPAWSPDGRKIAFASNRDGNFEIYVMNADGSGQTRLTRNRVDDTVPAWR